MNGQRYTPEFKDEAVKLVTDRGYSVADVADRLGVSQHSVYKWVESPHSKEDKRLLALIRSSYDARFGIYGYRRITLDLRELGETCSRHRVLRIMNENGIAAIRGYKRHKSYGYGRPSIVMPKINNQNWMFQS
ncbi:MAG: IS3 family transposase [Psychromonas sp.]|nr:IS3 family transposase [Psychromonas sp.]